MENWQITLNKPKEKQISVLEKSMEQNTPTQFHWPFLTGSRTDLNITNEPFVKTIKNC